MRAVVLEQYGGPEVLQVKQIDDPVAGPDEVIVEIVSTAVNRAELLQRMGMYPQPGPRSRHEIPGLEFAGVVVGARRAGQRVEPRRRGDGHRRRWRLRREDRRARAPARSGAVDGRCSPTRSDPRGLVHGLRRARQPRWTRARLHRARACRRFGRRHRRDPDLQGDRGRRHHHGLGREARPVPRARCRPRRRLRQRRLRRRGPRVHDGRGVDVVLDVIGGDYLSRDLAALAPKGRIVQVGTMDGGRAPRSTSAH